MKSHKQDDYWSVRNVLAAAVRAGVQRDPRRLTSCEWDMSGDCRNPRRLQRFARPPSPMVKGLMRKVATKTGKLVDRFVATNDPGARWVQPRSIGIDGCGSGLTPVRHAPAGNDATAGGMWTQRGLTPIWVTQIVRCGKCAACLRLRARKWTARGLREYSRASRTWFVTLTIRPEIHNWIRAQAAGLFEKAFVDRKPGDFDALPQAVQFAKCHDVAAQEVTRYLKRIRHTTTSGVRYLLVAEPHEGGGDNHGLPHYHLLIHETGEATLRKRVLDNRWRWGHTKARLVRESSRSEKAVEYLCKYLSKSKASRIRASLMYGNTSSDIAQGVETPEREANDPPNLLCLSTDAPASAERGAAERQEGIGGTALSGTVAVGLDGQLQRYSAMVGDRRTAADARLGGPGSINAFRKLAAKGYARRDPAYVSASKATYALVGHEPKPTGPFSEIEGSESNIGDAGGSLPGFELEDRAVPDKEATGTQRAELLTRNAAAAVARGLPAARRARIDAERERFQRQYGSAVAHPPGMGAAAFAEGAKITPTLKRLPFHGYRVHTATLRPAARKKPGKLRRG